MERSGIKRGSEATRSDSWYNAPHLASKTVHYFSKMNWEEFKADLRGEEGGEITPPEIHNKPMKFQAALPFASWISRLIPT
ncbi:MAG: hypothetical protein MK193_14410 [Lentisphaeria bacterium]|nr:hypothetical protein [Lentisphaeria bacterium]